MEHITANTESQPIGGHVSPDPGSPYLITVQIEQQFEASLDADALHKLAIAVLEAESLSGPLELGVVVTTDAEVHALNREYLGHDYKTDVLSFGMSEPSGGLPGEGMNSRFIAPPERPAYLGDIAISYERAAEQAPEYGHSAEGEVALLLIHGILHLLGYDDTTETEHDRMHARQQELFERLYGPKI